MYIINMKSFIVFWSFVFICFFASSCFWGGTQKNTEIVSIRGMLESSPSLLNKYQLLFMINGEKYDNVWGTYLDENFKRWATPRSENVHIKDYPFGFCNTFFSDPKFGCGNVRTGEFDMSVVLENVETGTKIPLGIQHVKMNEYKHTLLLAQVFIGSDRGLYKKRPKNEFNWDVATAVHSEDIQDTIFYYYKKYKRDSYIDFIDVDFFTEVP